MIFIFVPLFPLIALILRDTKNWLRWVSVFFVGLSIFLIIFSIWLMIELYDESIEFNNMMQQSESNIE